ncbi:MAG: 50S ribosomal protein L24 [Myxococcota bacterium]|nr:50S ribosomal protein L24 [Myxococcota bacterium]
MARKIRKGDQVQVIAGKYAPQRGTVLEVLAEKDRIKIEGVGVQKRHIKAGQSARLPNGGIEDKIPSIHISNVALVDPADDKPTRVGFKILENGDKVRVAKRSGEVLGA